MVDNNGRKLETGQLISIKNLRYKNGRYFFIEGINQDNIYGKRVNKDWSEALRK